MPRATELASGIQMIDTNMVGYDGLVAAFVVPGDRPAVVETGPATVTDTLTDALVDLGYGPNDIAYFVMSHIHLDHAGAAGDIVERFPNATVVVHSAGAQHMADPSRLMRSAYRVFGDKLDTTFGPLKAVPSDRLMAVDPGASLDLGGGRSLEIIEATGHAVHHMGVQDSGSGVIFVGDSMGVFLPEGGVLRPATPPPDFHLEQALATLQRFRERDPQGLYLTHYGPAPVDADLLAVAEERLITFGRIIQEAMEESTDVEFLSERLKERTFDDYRNVHADPELSAKFEALNAWRSTAAGYLRYFQTSGG